MAERRGRVGERLERREDDRPLLDRAVQSIPGIAPRRVRRDVVPADEPLVDGVGEQHDVAARLDRIASARSLSAPVIFSPPRSYCATVSGSAKIRSIATTLAGARRRKSSVLENATRGQGQWPKIWRKVADAGVGDLDEDDVVTSGRGVGRQAHPPVVRLQLGRFERAGAHGGQDISAASAPSASAATSLRSGSETFVNADVGLTN